MDENIEEQKQRISQIIQDCENALSQMIGNLDISVQKQAEITSLYNRINDIKSESETRIGGINELHSQIQAVKNEVDGIIIQIRENERQTIEISNTIIQKSDNIDSYFNTTFQSIKRRIDDPENGLQATVNKSKGLHGEITQLLDKSKVDRSEIETLKTKTTEAHKQSKKYSEEMSSLVTDSQALKNQISEILDLVRDTGLANSFDRRRKRSPKSLFIWGTVILLGVGLSVLLVYWLFIMESNDGYNFIMRDDINFWMVLLRISIASPSIFLIWFSAAQYSKERYILEQYEFKTAAALALENYTQLLRDNYYEKEMKRTY